MDNFPISIKKNKNVHHFEVGEYLHHDGERCKYKVFEAGVLVAAFEPDVHEHLRICKNSGNLDEAVLNALADSIEAHLF